MAKLDSVPWEDEWFYPECKTDQKYFIQAGQRLQLAEKKENVVTLK